MVTESQSDGYASFHPRCATTEYYARAPTTYDRAVAICRTAGRRALHQAGLAATRLRIARLSAPKGPHVTSERRISRGHPDKPGSCGVPGRAWARSAQATHHHLPGHEPHRVVQDEGRKARISDTDQRDAAPGDGTRGSGRCAPAGSEGGAAAPAALRRRLNRARPGSPGSTPGTCPPWPSRSVWRNGEQLVSSMRRSPETHGPVPAPESGAGHSWSFNIDHADGDQTRLLRRQRAAQTLFQLRCAAWPDSGLR